MTICLRICNKYQGVVSEMPVQRTWFKGDQKRAEDQKRGPDGGPDVGGHPLYLTILVV